MSDPVKPRRVRLQPWSLPVAVQDDPEKLRAWWRMWRRIMLRWWGLGACLMIPWLVVMVLMYRFHVIPETVAVGSVCGWFALGIGIAFIVRRWAQREMEDFARRELPEEQWS